MNRTLLHVLGVLLLSSCVLAMEGDEYRFENLDLQLQEQNQEGRTFFFTNFSTTGSFVTFNTTLLLFSSGIILWGIAGGIALYYLITIPHKEEGFYEYDSGYSSYGGDNDEYSSRSNRRSFNPYAIDWDKFSILDWIAVGEEAYNKFDPADLECQKRLICEVHQNTAKFGLAAKRIVDIFSYLQYAEVLHLPEEIKALIEEYLDAADRGRNPQKECGDVFTTCDFSVKRIFDKFSQNEV